MVPNLGNRVVARLRLIGQMQAWTVGGENILPPERGTQALLAVIAFLAPRKASRRWLTGLLWSRLPNAAGSNALRAEVRRLSDALAPAGAGFLVANRDFVSLQAGAFWIDTQEIMRANVGYPGALSLLDGELLQDLDGIDPAFDIWLKKRREHLRDGARSVAEANLLSQNTPAAIIVAVHRLLSIDPVHEGGWRALMRAYAEQGDHGMAMRAYEQCRVALSQREAAPSAQTLELMAQIAMEISGPMQRSPARSSELETRPESLADGTPPAAGRVPPKWPHVGVLPMRCIGLADEEALLGPRLAHEITSGLARFFRVTVTAPGAIARFARAHHDEAALRRAFGIDCLLDGTIQRDRDRLRVSLRLFDLRSGNRIVWAERFDRTERDLKAALDGIAAEAVARIEPELQLIEALRGPATPELSANDLLLSTILPMIRMDRDGFMRAGAHLEQAVTREPDFCDVHAWYAFWHALLVSQGWTPEPRQTLTRGCELAERAVEINPLAGRALTIAGLLRAQVDHDLRGAAALYDRALEVNPNLPMTWALSAVTCTNTGNIAEAERRFNTYKLLSPHNRITFIFEAFFAPIHVIKHDYQTAITSAHALIQLNPAFSASYKPHLAALGHLRHHEEAASVLQRLLALEPNFTIGYFLATTPMRREIDRDHFAEGLRLAGVS